MGPVDSILTDEVRRTIAIKHLRQLDVLAVDDLEAKVASRTAKLNPLTNPISKPIDVPTFFQTMRGWTDAHLQNIKSALYYQVSGGKPDWNCIFLAFMESAGMYLRDDTTLLRAVVAYRKGHVDNALKLYGASYLWINFLASLWGMDFVMICDLVDHNPVGHDDWDGPFCGVFYNARGGYLPSIGIAFKGTGALEEAIVDFHYSPVDGGPYLRHIKVSHGVHVGLFGEFKKERSKPETETAWGLINQGVALIRPENSQKYITRIHVTGHSLGASYATLCWLAIHYNPIKSAISLSLEDIYTFGSPRVGLIDLLDAYAKATGGLRSWRIVDWLYVYFVFYSEQYQDAVTQVPPVSDWKPGPPETVFLHIDNGISIYSNKRPVKMPSEKGTVPQPYSLENWDIGYQGDAHLTGNYYASLNNILTNGPLAFKGEQAVRCEVPFGDGPESANLPTHEASHSK